MTTSVATLDAYFALVRPLRAHLADVLRDHGDPNASTVLGAPSDAYEALLDDCIVAVRDPPARWPAYIPSPPMAHMREVRQCSARSPLLTAMRAQILDKALVALFSKRGAAKVDNLLALGFRRVCASPAPVAAARPRSRAARRATARPRTRGPARARASRACSSTRSTPRCKPPRGRSSSSGPSPRPPRACAEPDTPPAPGQIRCCTC
jgi:hypothetical protein